MDTMTQPKITGYRELNEEEANLMNRIKAHGAALQILIDNVVADGNPDPRWVAIARTDFQTGLMALTRAVAKPTSF